MVEADIQHYFSYSLQLDNNGELIDENGKYFDMDAYSRMKWGVIPDTRYFADELVETLSTERPVLVQDPMPPGLIVVYESLPHAATILTEYTLDGLNLIRSSNGVEPGELVHLYAPDYLDDYAGSSREERRRIISRQQQESLLYSDKVASLQPVIIDDIYVTGTTVQAIAESVRQYTDHPITGGYIAKINDEVAYSLPEIEEQLDESAIKSIDQLLPYILHGEFAFTHGFYKELLTADSQKVEDFLVQLPHDMVSSILNELSKHHHASAYYSPSSFS